MSAGTTTGATAVGGAGPDLYWALGVNRNCTGQDVKTAFRRMALTLHPDRARLAAHPAHPHQERGELVIAEDARFALAARAYEVLVDPRTRAVYDLHGHARLPQYHGDPHRTFRMFFGTDNPFQALIRDGVHLDVEEPKPPETIVVPVPVTLEEVNEGVTKACTVAVRVPASPAGDATALVERSFSVRVPPGALTGTKYTLRKQGHQDPGRPPGDVVAVLEEVPHARFTREGADLVQSETVSLREALTGCTILIVTLDGRLIRVAITDIVRPGYEKRVAGEGLPHAGGRGLGRGAGRQDSARGSLVLRLDVRFPVSLSRPCKALLDQALQLHEQQTPVAADAVAPRASPPGRAILEDTIRREAEGGGE